VIFMAAILGCAGPRAQWGRRAAMDTGLP
jgi:hypothetical protein